MADEELRLVAILDDRASEGLAKLQQNVRQLGSGPNIEPMAKMQQQAGGVTDGLKSMASGFSNATTGMLGFTAIAAAIPAALVGMTASFATSGINQFAERMSALGRNADAAGIDLAQYKANISTLKTAGITDAEAEATIKRFSRIQTEVGQMGSKVRNSILAATPLYGKDEMNAWLDKVMVLPTHQAMQKVRDRGKEIRQSVYDESFRQTEDHEDAMRKAADAEEEWLSKWGATVLANIRKPFRDATAEEERLMTERRAAADKWGDATHDISEAWGDIKDTIGSIAMVALLPVAQGIATAMRGAADAVRIIERWWKKPEGTTIVDLVDDLEKRFPTLEPLWTPLRDFLRDPPPGLVAMWRQLKTDASGFWESTKKDWEFVKSAGKAVWEFWKLPEEDQTFLALIKSFEQQFPAFERRAKPIRQWFEKPPDERSLVGLMKAIEQSVPELENYIKPIRGFVENPSGTLLRLFLNAQHAATEMIPKSIRDFINEPKWDNFKTMISDAKRAFSEMIPEPLKNLLFGERPPGPTGEELFGVEHGGGGIPPPPPPQEPEAPTESVADSGAGTSRLGRLRQWFTGAKPKPMQHGGIVTQPTHALLGEAGPEAVVPLQKAPGGLFPGLNRLLDITGMREPLMEALPTLIPSAISGLAEFGHHAGIPGAGLVSVGADIFGAGADVGLRGAGRAFSRREMQKYATLGAPILNALEAAQMGLAREDVQGFLKEYLPSRAVEELVGFSTAEGPRGGGPGPRGIFELLSSAGTALDRSAAQRINVSSTGQIMVDVRAPDGTRVDATAGGLFNSTEINRSASFGG